MDKEMEKKQSPSQGQGRKGKPPATQNITTAAGAGAVTSDGSSHSFKAAEFNSRVARKAYELFERRGGESGSDLQDWLAAEQVVKEEIARAKS